MFVCGLKHCNDCKIQHVKIIVFFFWFAVAVAVTAVVTPNLKAETSSHRSFQMIILEEMDQYIV